MKIKLLIVFLLFYICNSLNAQIADLKKVNVDTSIQPYDGYVKSVQDFFMLKTKSNLGPLFQSLNEIRIGVYLHKLKVADSITYKYFWAALSINKESSCNCFSIFNDFKILDTLQHSEQWRRMLRYCAYKPTKYAYTTQFTDDLYEDLTNIHTNDQLFRSELGILSFIFNDDQAHFKGITEKQALLDSLNLIQIEKITKTRGFPGALTVREDLAGVASLVILHAQSLEVKEKYLPIFIDAYNRKDIDKNSLEILVDKIHVRKYSKQVFGTQYGYWDAIEKRRTIYPLLEEAERNLVIKNLNLKR